LPVSARKRAISALNHARIATIFGIEETKTAKFLVLEYLPGGTLRQKLLARKATGDRTSIQECWDGRSRSRKAWPTLTNTA
jgi:hypothetical protein